MEEARVSAGTEALQGIFVPSLESLEQRGQFQAWYSARGRAPFSPFVLGGPRRDGCAGI